MSVAAGRRNAGFRSVMYGDVIDVKIRPRDEVRPR
jgi:hypothetical protein